MKHIQQHHDLDSLGPILQHIEGVCFGPARDMYLNFVLFAPNSQESMKGQGMCEMNLTLVVGKK
jgi:hypothetical protein